MMAKLIDVNDYIKDGEVVRLQFPQPLLNLVFSLAKIVDAVSSDDDEPSGLSIPVGFYCSPTDAEGYKAFILESQGCSDSTYPYIAKNNPETERFLEKIGRKDGFFVIGDKTYGALKSSELLQPLFNDINQFIFSDNPDIGLFEKNINKTLEDIKSKIKDPTYGDHIIDAVVVLFRAFFRVFDLTFSWLTGNTTMAESETPLALKLTGKKHFFERPDSKRAPIEFNQACEAVGETIKSLQEAASGPSV